MNPHETLTVREGLDRIGLVLFPEHWTGKEYLDHWRLGLSPWPPSKLRGMQAIKELLRLVWEGDVAVEIEVGPDSYEPCSFVVHHFHAQDSSCAGDDEAYYPCRLKFPRGLPHANSNAGRKGHDFPPIVVRILAYLDEHGTSQKADEITHAIRVELQKEGLKAPSYGRLQPYVSALLSYRRTQDQALPK